MELKSVSRLRQLFRIEIDITSGIDLHFSSSKFLRSILDFGFEKIGRQSILSKYFFKSIPRRHFESLVRTRPFHHREPRRHHDSLIVFDVAFYHPCCLLFQLLGITSGKGNPQTQTTCNIETGFTES